MSTMGTFDAFTAARLGIYSAQIGFQVTGNNISNINTAGYTRQRLDQVSFKAGAYDMYRSQMDNHVGSGALVMGINQVRDPYLDLRYRNTNADVGYSEGMLEGLQKIAAIIDEIGLGEDASSNEEGDGILHAQFQDLADKLREYAKEPTSLNDTLVRNSAETLCYLLNDYANKLDSLYKETVEDFSSQVTEVNECLTNIRDLNREIRDCEIFGDSALELRDERNRQIDALSKYLHIKVVYSEEDIGSGQTVEKLSIYLAGDNPDDKVRTDDALLIDGIFGAQLSAPDERVVPNPKCGSTDPADADVAGFLYVKEWEEDNTTDPPTMKVTAGTNFVEDALKVENDNFSLQVSKLLDHKGNEWTDRVINRADVTVKAPANAVYEIQLNSTLTAGEELDIGGTTYTLGAGDVDENDPDVLARFVADKLNALNNDYTVSAKGDGKGTLVYTAKYTGEIGSTVDDGRPDTEQPPKQMPSLSVTNGDGKLSLGSLICMNPGYQNEPPNGVTVPSSTTETDPDTGVTTTVTFAESNGRYYQITTITRPTNEVALDDNDLYGKLQATRELLTEAGEFTTKDTLAYVDEYSTEKRGIPYYKYSLDLLAKQFAAQYNEINQGYQLNKDGNYVDKDGAVLELAGEPINKYDGLTADQKQALIDGGCVLMDKDGQPMLDDDGEQIPDLNRWLDAKDAVKMGGVLFSNRNDRDDPEGITAGNISVAQSWSNGSVQLVPKFEVLFDENGESMDHTTQNTNANHMLAMIEKGLLYDPTQIVEDAVSSKLFEGSFNDMFSNMNSALGKDIRANNISLNNSYVRLVDTDASREGVSGVDLNDEAMNLMQFQKAYSAACRLMTVVDEALDRLINNTAM